MKELIRQSRAWVPVLKSAALFLLPFPLLIAFFVALVGGEIGRLAAISGAIFAFFCAGVLTWRGLVAQARFFLGQQLDPPAVPLKTVSAILTALGAGLAAAAGGHALAGTGAFAALAAVGYFCFYGRDPKRKRIDLPEVAGVDRNTVRSIAVPEFVERLKRIIGIGKQILAEIERDPRDAARARRFLHLYLDSAEKVTVEYARTHRQIRSRPLEQNFRQLLVDMEQTFEAQHQKLLENDVLTLDVEIEVLNARLKREGIN